MSKYIDSAGLVYLWNKIKSWVGNYAKITTSNGVSTIHIGDADVTPVTTETDPTVPAWAKAATKPTYTADEVGALPDSTVIPGGTTTAPKMDGTATVGTETKWAHGDHVHPHDTTKANASEMTVSTNGDKTTITLKTGTSATVINEHQDISGKADKVANATAGNVATLDANGNLVDSGKSADSIGTDTKNTAGSTADANKLYIIGAKSQAANPRTYSQANAYITAGKVYSNAKETVNLSDTQTLTNKTLTSPTLNGTPTAPTATAGTNSTQVATTAFVNTAIQNAQVGAATFQGTAPTTFAPTNYKKGYYWIVDTAGTYVGDTCEPGDMIFCIEDYSTAYKASDFSVIQTNLDISPMTNAEMDTATNNWT